MKLRSTTPVSGSFVSRVSLVAMAVLVAGSGVAGFSSYVVARDYDSEIKAKEQEASQYNAEASRLGEMAESLQGELDKLNDQIAQIQNQIAETQKKIDELNVQIDKSQQLIKQNRKAMGQILADIHVDDQISPLEMLASSNNIGDFIDKQEQRSSLKTSLNTKIKEIKALQKKLEEDKKLVQAKLKDQESQQATLSSKQSEKAKLIADTKNDQNNYAALAQKRNSEVAKLREEQLKENKKRFIIGAGSAGSGGYPSAWANAPLDAYVDDWGLYTRECVSYVAWKVASTGRYVPHFGGAGHANQWPSTTKKHGIEQGSVPRVGAAAVSMAGEYGHVMYVEAVNGDGTITISDYNRGWDGLYRGPDARGSRIPASGLIYIYF